jgi:hypothetical protein
MLVRDTMKIGFRYPIELYALEKVLRFPVLAHGRSRPTRARRSSPLMQDIDVGLLGTVPEVPANAPGAEAGPEVVRPAIGPVGHPARRPGARLVRGPCVPFPTPRNGGTDNQPLPLAHSADQLRRVVPDGREDLALSAAFEIGRLLAVSQLSVVSALLRFRAEQFGAGRVRELLTQVLSFPLPGLGGLAREADRFRPLRRAQMNGVMAADADRMVGPRRPVAVLAEIKVDGDLDAVVAAGLGLDLVIAKACRQRRRAGRARTDIGAARLRPGRPEPRCRAGQRGAAAPQPRAHPGGCAAGAAVSVGRRAGGVGGAGGGSAAPARPTCAAAPLAGARRARPAHRRSLRPDDKEGTP